MAHYPPNNHYLSVTTKEETYAPKSPDLSATFDDFDTVDTPHPQHQQYRGSVSHFAPYTPTTEPTRSPWGSISQQGGLPYGQVQQQHPQGHSGYFPPQQLQQQPLQHPNPYYSPHQAQAYLPTGPSMVKQEDGDYIPGEGGRPQRVKAEGGGAAGFGTATTSNGFALADIEVKTKFPIARIKRIMQADEDVGKVAQVTPVVVSKALELFMISLVTKAAAQAKARNSKRVLASHLKEAVMADEQFDFLNEIVAKVADAPTAASKKEEPDSDENEGAAPAKRKRAPRKKRKDSDEF